MDDPWGSPWADEVQHPPTATNAPGDGEGNEVKPKTPVKASTLGLEHKPNSPWDDEDDGFGEWAVVPAAVDVKGSGLAFDGTGDSWQARDTGDKRDEIKSEINGLSLSWSDHKPLPVHNLPNLAPSLMSNSVSTARQPSPDPWASEATLNDDHKGRGVGLEGSVQKRGSTGTLSGDMPGALAEHNIEPPPELLGGLHKPIPENAETSESDLASSSADVQKKTPDFLHEPRGTMPGIRTTGESELENLKSESEVDTPGPARSIEEDVDGHESSRPSSSPSDQSHHEEILAESPRTSMDEEPKRPQRTRKLSSKVQELVEHFDGLIMQEEDVIGEPGLNRNRSKTPSLQTDQITEMPEESKATDKREDEAEEDDDDFGDFEDGQSEIEEPTEKEGVNRPVTPTPVQSEISLSPASKMVSPQRISPRSHYVKKDYGRVEFAVSASALDDFYAQSGGAAPKDTSVEKVFIMDAIPFGSFESSEERKTWYRISRYGSMRKHNSGNDDNYIRVTWHQSQVREQTLIIVARWMEEDRLSGRVVLGGGSKGSSIFGWNDSNAPAMPLSSAFAAKQGKGPMPVNASVEAIPEIPREWPKGLARDRSTSGSHTSTKARQRSSAKSAGISESYKGSTQLPVANFGWSASPTTREQSPIPLAKEAQTVVHSTIKADSPSRQSQPLHPRPTASSILIPGKANESRKPIESKGRFDILRSKPTAPVIPPITAPVSVEEDEWGEMVASPVVATAPVLPPTQGLRHEKLQSPIGTFSPPVQISVVDSHISTLPARGHKPSMSFDDILMPRPRNSFDSKSDIFPSDSATTTSLSSFSNSAFPPSPSLVPASNNNDPWASADLSFFDSLSPASKPMPPKSVTPAKAPPVPSPLRHGKTRQEIEQDEIVAGVVKSLPNLSYMLRR